MVSLRSATMIVLGSLAFDAPPPLRVIRTTPAPEATAGSTITITFDRPVAGSLDQSVDPRDLLTIEPSLQGTTEWRDPVTLRFLAREPLAAGVTYQVTVKPDFQALDGSRLPEAFRFGFRVTGPRILAGLPVGPGESPRFLRPNESLTLALSGAVDARALERLAYVEFNGCTGAGQVRLVATGQRQIPDDASWRFREAGGWDRDRSADSLRRLVTVRPATPLPRGCRGFLVAPEAIDAERPGTFQRFPLETYGGFRLDSVGCGNTQHCPTGPIQVVFSTPVRGAEVLRHVRVLPKTTFTLSDTSVARDRWTLWAELKPRTGYLVEVDRNLVDDFGQTLTGNPRGTAVTTGYAPAVSYSTGRLTIERHGPRTLPVTYVNVDTLEVITAAVPESLEAKLLSRSWYSWDEDWARLSPRAGVRKVAVGAPRDRHGVYGVPFNAPDASAGWVPTLFAVKVTNRVLPRRTLETGEPSKADYQPVALVQITDLGVHAKIGREEGVVWVTGARDGQPRAGVTLRVRDAHGRLLAQGVTDAAGLYRFTGVSRAAPPANGDEDRNEDFFEGYVEARLGADRALVGVTQYDPDLSPWQFNVASSWGADRYPLAAAVFTERGIYRPGDSVFAKAIVRTGNLGALAVPARSDSVRLTFKERDGGPLAEFTTVASAFGTTDRVVRLPPDAPLGDYLVTVAMRREGQWQEIATAGYRVAEYRAPEFLVDVTADTAARRNGDVLRATVSARYLFGAPMARARVNWSVRQRSIPAYELEVPGAEGYFLAARGWWWEEWENRTGSSVSEARADSLDGAGQLVVDAPLQLSNPTLPARVSVDAVVTDVNRQTVYGSASVVVHPTDFYIGAKPAGSSYFWNAATPETVNVIAVRPSGTRVPDVAVTGALIRREWHQVRRENDGYSELVGEWVQDTVDRCRVRTAAEPVSCRLTPNRPGNYSVIFTAADGAGREVSTSFYRWATGPGWVPWADASQFKMDVIPDKSRYAVGDTATVLFASPFTDAEAWITVEREGLIEQRRLRIADGATSLRLPVTEAWAPNAFVSIVVARGRSAAPSRLDDPGRPTLRVGYAEVRVTPERKRLTVTLSADQAEYRPGDGAAISATVRDAGRGVRSEVTLWAVDEGVLSLTGFRTPDPIALLYQPRALGLRLASNLTTVVPQVAQGDKGRNAGGGGGEGANEILRSRFKTTAFFLGAVITDSTGTGVAKVTLPDNLTTFRVMAVAVTAGDRYGSGQSPLLVTRPLIARPALPRFLRPGDVITAGVVVNHRTGGTPVVDVKATAQGVRLQGRSSQRATLEAGRGREVRFGFRAEEADSAVFRFDVSGAGDRDAVRLAIPVRPAFRATISTVAGAVHDTARVTLPLSGTADVSRSTVTLNLGSSPSTLLRGYADELRVYPYYCSEQVSSVALPLIALHRARQQAGTGGDTVSLRREIDRAVAVLVRRQRGDGGIGLWSATDWSSALMSAHAGAVLLEARAAGVPVADTVLAGIAGYLETSLERQENMALSVGLRDTDTRARLTERVAAAEYLSRLGRRNRPLENELIRRLGQIAPADRMEFAITLVRSNDRATARRILEPLWGLARVEGRTAVLPDSLASRHYFRSPVRAPALLLLATLAVDPSHPLLAPLLETVVSRGRGQASSWAWNTQDFAMAVRAVDAWQRRFPPAEQPGLDLQVAGRRLLSVAPGMAVADSVIPLSRMIRGKPAPVPIDLATTGPAGPVFYYLTLSELPLVAPVNPEDRGLRVERWYEDVRTGRPIISATEGDLVRVRLRITAPAERAFVVVDDPLPAGLEAIDLGLRTVGGLAGPGQTAPLEPEGREGDGDGGAGRWSFGSWDRGWWSPFDHRELRDDRVVYAARLLWPGTYTASYLARATTPGSFVRPQAHVEEMYNPAVFGRSDGGRFDVRARQP